MVLWMATVVAVLILAGRLVYWQVIRHQHLKEFGEQWQLVDVPIPSLRGKIMDRNGFILAMDEYEFEIFATPRDINNPSELASQLAPILGKDQGELVDLLSQKNEPSVTLVWNAPWEVVRRVEEIKKQEWGAAGLGISPARKRVYPESQMACHLLGFVTHDHEVDYKAFYGVEEQYGEELRGVQGSWGSTSDALDLQITVGPSKLVLPQDGSDVVLTIDRTIQHLVEEELLRGIRENRADKGTIIVMNPRTGAVLAMASYPGYDPNPPFGQQISEEQFRNPAVSEVYEPGSVFKVVTMASALDAGIVGRYTTYYDNGQIFVGGQVIMNWDRKAYGETSMTELLSHSLNVGAATLSTNLGADRFYEHLNRFGFGQLTGIDLPHESEGIMRVPGDGNWREGDLGTNAFGQGIAVTPIQMITGAAAVANDGALPKPYVVERIEQAGQVTEEFGPQPGRRVISSQVARELTEMLVDCAAANQHLTIPGYSIAGKTGTAQIPIVGGYHPEDTIASFVGYAPADEPEFIILINVERPRESPWGAQVAAPVFRRIAERLFVYLTIPPDEVRIASR